jgi:hypothetical protein
MAAGQRPCVGLRLLPRTACLALSSPLPPLPSLPSISPWQFELGWETLPNEHADAHGGASPGWADGSAMPVWWPRSKLRSTPSARYAGNKQPWAYECPDASNAQNLTAHEESNELK